MVVMVLVSVKLLGIATADMSVEVAVKARIREYVEYMLGRVENGEINRTSLDVGGDY